MAADRRQADTRFICGHTRGARFRAVVRQVGASADAFFSGWPMVKAYRIVAEYAGRLYYPLHAVPSRRRLMITPRLLLIEYLVYRVDAVLERNRANDLELTRTSDYGRLHRYKALFRILLRLLGAWSGALAARIDDGEAFARLENAVMARDDTTERDLRKMAELRPADVRLMHAMIEAMLGLPHDASLHQVLWPAEVLADIANDLEHYQQDVAAENFNLYVEFLRLYGDQGPMRFRLLIEDYQSELARRAETLPSGRQDAVRLHCKALLRDRLASLPESPVDV